MLITYVMIIRESYQKTRMNDTNESQVKVKYRKKVVTFVSIIILVFFICWSPFGIAYIITAMTHKDYEPTDSNIANNKRLFRIVTFPCYFAATLNVVCFGIKDKEIRRCFKALFRFKNPARLSCVPPNQSCYRQRTLTATSLA